MPPGDFPRVLDLCCGRGRHAIELAQLGYQVTGIDRHAGAIDAARAAAHAAGVTTTLAVADMRRPGLAPESLDGCVSLWQSFGYFGDLENLSVLRAIRAALRPGGRLLLDIYNGTFFPHYQGNRISQIAGRTVHGTQRCAGSRLLVTLRYEGSHETDSFDWRLYTPAELPGLAEATGFRLMSCCANFDESLEPTPERPRMQAVFEATGKNS
jgi:SAM-dependent methyltransferase